MRVVIAVFLVLAFGGSASAQSCNALRSQLASAQSGGGPSMAQLQSQYNSAGCVKSAFWGKPRACARIEQQMRRGGGPDSARVRVLQQQTAAACGGARQAAAQPVAAREARAPVVQTRIVGGRVVVDTRTDVDGGEDGLLGGFFDGFRRRDRDEFTTARINPKARIERIPLGEPSGDRRRRTDHGGGGDGLLAFDGGASGKSLREGSSRTVCVRLCDGFYFPINSRSHTDNFYQELAMCVGRCPGADVSLYVHGNEDPVEGMHSTLTGERYANLPTAFLYRKQAVANCGCQPQTIVATADLSVEKTLGYVGLGQSGDGIPETATEAAVAAADGGVAWTPLRAVYDQTGKALPPSLTDRSIASLTGTDADAPRSGLGTAGALRPTEPATARLPLTGDEPLRIREVGPQFYSRTVEIDPSQPEEPRLRATVTTTAVTVVPLPDRLELVDRQHAAAGGTTWAAAVDAVATSNGFAGGEP